MTFNQELNDRQSARVIEQAIRARVAMRIDPHYASGGEALTVQLLDATDECLSFAFGPDQAAASGKFLPGQFCQVQFSLNGAIYMLTVHVIAIEIPQASPGLPGGPCVLVTNRPKVAQILERRRFIRTQLATRTPVMVRWLEHDRLAEATLFNIGGGGLAFNIARDFADLIHVGDLMEATVELTGLPKRFAFKVSICNKTVASDSTSVIVGAQFLEAPESGQAGALDELRRFLVTQQQATISR